MITPFATSIILTAVLYRAGLNHPTLDAWPLAALSGVVTIAVWLSWHNMDVQRHTLPVALAVTVSVILYRVGCHIGNVPGLPLTGPMMGLVFGLFGFCAFHKAINRSFNDFVGGLMVDLVFSEGPFGEKIHAPKKLPELILLRHWREHGLVYKAYRAACRNLSERTETYPLWLFAAETAALENHIPVAEDLIRRLCDCTTFTAEQKAFAVRELKRWEAATGRELHEGQFEIEPEPVAAQIPLDEARRLRERGRFDEAEKALQHLLERDPGNLSAILLLARIHAQDQKNPRKAEKLLARLDREQFVPGDFVEFAWRSLDVWSLLPPGEESVRILSGNPPGTALAGKSVEDLLTEGRLGSALEEAESQAVAAPHDFTAWLRLLKIHALHTGSVIRADETFFKILVNPAFREEQKQQAGRVADECRRERSRQAFRINRKP